MSTGGWFTMIVSVGFVVTLFLWCICRVILEKRSDGHLHGIEDIEKGED